MLWSVPLARAVPVDQVSNPTPESWVSDMAHVLDDSEEASLDARIDALHRDLGVEIAVVTVPEATDRDGEVLVPKDFATELFDAWGIGDDQANNGLLVLLVIDQRRLEMETGYGLEAVLSDGWLGGLQSSRMVPRFRERDFAGGLRAGLAEIDTRLRANPEDARLGTGGPMWTQERRRQTSQKLAAGAGAVAVLGAGLGLGGVGARYRRRQRTCDKCDVYMPMLDEADEDAHLDAAQQLEERLGSVDHQVHQCPSCGEVRSFARWRAFSGYHHCHKCSRKTRSTSSSPGHAGTVHVNERCSHCGDHSSYTRAAPRPSSTHRSSSSRGSSGGSSRSSSGRSFGGGRSGGGGAGSSW